MKFAICGNEQSLYGISVLRRMIDKGLKPAALFLIDHNDQNCALTRKLYSRGESCFSVDSTILYSFSKEEQDSSLLAIAAEHSLPCYCITSFDDPMIASYYRRENADLLVNLDCPPLRGDVLYLAPYGVLSVHAARLPTFRGNDATAMSICNNAPLEASAFVMTPWMDEGVLLARRSIPVCRGDKMDDVNRRALNETSELYCDVLCMLSEGSIRGERQNEWEGTTYRRKGQVGTIDAAIDERFIQRADEILKEESTYAYYSPSDC